MLAALLLFAIVAPWTRRNCRVMDACALVSTNAGWNLVIGSAPGATGKFEFLVGHTPEGAPACDEGGQVAQDRCWWRYGVALIRREPLRWLRLIPAKLRYTLDSEWFPINYLREARPDLVSKQLHVQVGHTLTALQQALVTLAAIGCLGWGGRGRTRVVQAGSALVLLSIIVWSLTQVAPTVWPMAVAVALLPWLPLAGSPTHSRFERGLAGVVLTTLVTHAVFFGEDRYHLVLTPALCIFAAGVGRTGVAQRDPLF